MRDNLRRYRAIRAALLQGYPGQPTGTVARYVTTLAALSSGIVGSKRTPLPSSATQVPDGAQAESRVKRFTRWVRHEQMTPEVSFVPYAQGFLAHVALQSLVLVIDGSMVGRGGVALMMPVVSTGRARPLAWLVRQGKKGHCPAALPSALVAPVEALRPAGAQVVVRGDGACAGTDLQHPLEEAGWSSVCRTALRTTATGEGTPFRLESLGACSKPGALMAWHDVRLTEDA